MPQLRELAVGQRLVGAVDVVGQQHLVAGLEQGQATQSAMAARPLGTSRHCCAAFERGDALLQHEGGRRAVQAVGVAGLGASSRARAWRRRRRR